MKLFQIPMVVTSLAGLCLFASLGVPAAHADFTFGQPTNLGPTINSSAWDGTPSISADGLELYFGSDRTGGYGGWDILRMTRRTKDDPWEEPVNLGPILNSPDQQVSPDISADGLTLWFDAGPLSRRDIWVAERITKDQPWGTPVKLGPNVNRTTWQYCPAISPDGLQLYFESGGAGEIFVSTRPTPSDTWPPAVNLGSPVNTSYHDSGPDISSDGLAMFFHSNRPGGYGDQDLYVTTRPTPDSAWGKPVNLGPTINTAYSESDASVSADGRMLYFSEYPRPRPGGMGGLDLWQTPIIPIVDFNGDGKVDSFEVSRMADRWGTDDSLCDIGPMPWGDGVVDVNDLKALAQSVGKEFEDPTLVAHWTLDETEGLDVLDSAGGHDGTVTGTAVWHPGAGRIDGALELDGSTFVGADHILSPSDGPFTVLVWVKGGAPGQVIFSQRYEGANWLTAAVPDGVLAMELKGTGRGNVPLTSQRVIADGDWHRVGLAWDGSRRRLYADDVAVAEDTSPVSMPESIGATQIGAGSTLAPGTFWTGLIDDVRIYNRALKP